MATLGKCAEGRLVGRDIASCPAFDTLPFFEVEYSSGSPHVLNVWAQVCLSGNRTWRHSASSKVGWMIDTWQLEAEGVMYPQASTGSFTSQWSCNWVFRASSLSFSSISSRFQGKIAQILHFLTVLSCGIVFPLFLRSFELVSNTVLLFFCFFEKNNRTLFRGFF